MKQWRMIDTGLGEGAWNMAVDEALLQCYTQEELPILHLYRWENTISLGRFSALEKSVDIGQLRKHNIGCVRRMSGGGILVHGSDLSYSLILPRNRCKEGVKANYRYWCTFLLRLYEKLGLKAHFVQESGLEQQHSNVCLAGCEPYDIAIEGKKMGGNAQRYTRNVLFQHGSIPMDLNETVFQSLFLEESGMKSAASLQKCGVEISYETLASLLTETFCETFGAEVLPSALSQNEEQNAKALFGKKYTQEGWNLYAKNLYSQA
ncbi:MAG: lipoate--protein ligase family protein [Campylobacterales bacterium]|nr:lipoate--protein ligase family protein [Campylobacterales bacterium]